MNKKITVNLAVAIAIIAMTVTFVVTMILSMQLFNRTVSGVREKEIMYNKLSEMDKSARENYYGEIVDDTLYDYIAAGYVTGMGDKDARYYTAKQYLEYLNQQNGVVNEALKSMGLLNEGLYWLKDGNLARIVVMIMCTWKYMGYYMVLLLAGITSISSDIYEAARIDGAGMVTTFFRITLPLMKNTLTFVIIQGMIGSLQLVEDPMTLLTGWISGGQSAVAGGPDRSSLTMMWYMYDTGFGTNMNYGYAASIAYATFIIIAIFAFIINMLLDRRGKDGE